MSLFFVCVQRADTAQACLRASFFQRLIFALLLWAAALPAMAALVISQGVSTNTIAVGDRVRLTITISNSSAQVDAAQLINNLPPQLRFYNPSFAGHVAPSTTCASAALTTAAGGGPGGVDQLSVTGFSIPGRVGSTDGSCTVSLDITSFEGGSSWQNVILATDLTPNAAGQATQSILVNNILLPAVSKSFGASALTQGATRTATITFTNANPSLSIPFTSFTDELPLNVDTTGVVSNTCGSTVSVVPKADPLTPARVTLSGGAIAPSSPGPGSCSLSFQVRGVLPPGVPSQVGTNTIAPGDIGNTRGVTYPGNSANITVNSPITLGKGFSPTPLSAGANSQLTVLIRNNSPDPLTNVSLSDTLAQGWPTAVRNAAAISTANLMNCGAGATLAAGLDGADEKGFVLANATIAPNGGECRVRFDVTSTTVGTHTNSIAVGAVTNAEGFTSPAQSANLEVRDNALTVTKAITPASVAPGDVATFAVSIRSFSLNPQPGVTFTDTLPTGMVYVDAANGGADPSISGTGCGSLVGPLPTPLTTAPSFTFNMPGAQPEGSTCVVSFTARVPSNATLGTNNLTNGVFGAGNGPGAGTVSGNSGAVSLSVINPLTVTKTFDGVSARQLFQGTPSVAEIVLVNNNFSPLANLAFTDTLPASPGPIRVAAVPGVANTCGGTLVANPGDGSFSLTGGSIPARLSVAPFTPGQCSVRVNVVGGTVGVHSNTIPAFTGANQALVVSATGTVANVPNTTVRNLNTSTATLQYLPALTVAKTFLTNPVQVGANSRVRITLGNNGNGVLTGVGVTDPLTGTGLQVANPPNASTTCAGGPTLTAVAGALTASLTGASLSGSSTCDFLFDVLTNTSTPSVNALAPGSVVADGGVANTTTTQATLNKITSSVNLTKGFAPTTIVGAGSVSRLTVSIDNVSASALTGLSVTDNLPAGMQVAVTPQAVTTCAGGIVTASPGGNTVALSGGTLAGNAGCTVAVDVTATVVGTLNNTLPAGAIGSDQGATNASPFTANLAALAGLGVEKSFLPSAVGVGQRSRLTIRLRNSLPQAITNITATDNFPAGLQVAVPPNLSTTCVGANLSTTANSISVTGGQLAAGPAACELQVDVLSNSAGAYANTIAGGTVIGNEGAVTNPQPGPTATLFVLLPPTVAKAFAASPVAAGQPNRLTVTISNPNPGQALSNVALRDDLPAGLFVAQVPNASTTCASGAVSAVASAGSAQVSGATVPAAGSCSFQFDTVSNVPGLYVNTIASNSLSSDQGLSNPDPASASVRVLQPPTLTKAFLPPTISPGGTSRLVLTLGNDNLAAQTLLQALDDNLPLGVVVAATPNVGGTCPGAVTAAAGTDLVRYANGASIPAGGCTIEVNVTAASAGTYTNQVLAGALRTAAGANPEPATANLVASPLGSVSGRVYADLNNNGVYDAGEPPLAGQSLSLIRSLDSVVLQKTTTDSGGFYVFSGLTDTASQGSNYTVRFLRSGSDSIGGPLVASTAINAVSNTVQGRIVVPATANESSITGGTGTVANPNNSNTDFVSRRSEIQLNAAAGNVASSINNNFSELPLSEISGTVYRDDNLNGVINGGEAGIAGVVVQLRGIDDLNQPVVLNATTDAQGRYVFANLRPSCTPLNAPSCPGYVLTQGAQPAATSNGLATAGTVVNSSSGAVVGTAGTASNNAPQVDYVGAPTSYSIPGGTSRITGIVLPPQSRSAGNHFGEISANRSISGRIFTDANGDGVFNSGDVGVGSGAAGANNLAQTLTLSGTDAGGNPVNQTTNTAADGTYSFAAVPPGAAYTLTCTTCAAPTGFVNSAAPLAFPGSTGGTAAGNAAVPQITGIVLTGTNTVSVNNLFTKTPPTQQISGFVYFDPDNSGGVRTPADASVPGQSVQLLDNGGAVLATTTTDVTGEYRFSSLTTPALVGGAVYQVRLAAAPAGTTAGQTSVGSIGGVPTGTATGAGISPAVVSNIALGAAQQSVQNNFALVADITVGGRVYEDLDLSGTFNGGDVGLSGSTIGLVGTDAFGNAVARYTTSNGTGQYSFAGLAPGNYSVRQTQPLGFTSVANTIGPVTGGSAGAVGALGGAVETLGLSFNATPAAASQVNFGEARVGATLVGFKAARISQPAGAAGVSPGNELVWQIIYKNDSAVAQVFDINDSLSAFVTRSGAPAISTQTGGGGSFVPDGAFTGAGANTRLGQATLPAGAWVSISVPTLVVPGSSSALLNQATAGTTNVRTDTVDATTPTGGAGQPPAGVIAADSVPQTSFQTAGLDATGVPLSSLPASLSGNVWRDNNGDRNRDSGDTPIPGWGVEILNANGSLVACRTTPSNSSGGCITMPDGRSLFATGADGSYGAIGLLPGSYRVQFRDPANNVIYGTPKNGSGDANSRVASSRDYIGITLLPGANMVQQDLPIDPSGVVYDTNSRLPIAGSSVSFCGPPGFDVATMLVGGASYANVGGCAQMTTGVNGFYQYLLNPTAPAGTYTLSASAPNYAPAPSSSIPPAPGVFTPAGPSPLLVQAQAGPPPAGQPTTYYLAFNLAPGVPDVIHNHIPLDPFFGAGLFLQKAVNREVVELGDSVLYTLRVLSPNGAATNVRISDQMPAGLRLIAGTVTQNGAVVADPPGAPGPVLNFQVGNFAANTTVTITYRVRVGVGAQQGDGINRAQAQGVVGGLNVASNRAQARIRITGGVFFREACVLGKVFVDCNGNRIQDEPELGIPGVRLYLQDGTWLISDSEGKYSMCGLPARTSVLKVDPTTLPPGSELVVGSNRHALDANSLFLDLKFGELHRADFVEGSCSAPVMDAVRERRRAGPVVAPGQPPGARTPSAVAPKPRVFESGRLGSPLKSSPTMPAAGGRP